MSRRMATFSDISHTLVPEGELARLTVRFPEGHRKAGAHRLDAAESEIARVLSMGPQKLATVSISFPDGSKKPRKITAPAHEIEKLLGDALTGSSARSMGGGGRNADNDGIVMQAITTALGAAKQPMTSKQLQTTLERPQGTIDRNLRQLLADKKVVIAGHVEGRGKPKTYKLK